MYRTRLAIVRLVAGLAITCCCLFFLGVRTARAEPVDFSLTIDTPVLAERLRALSELANDQDTPRTLSSLRASVRADISTMRKLLRAEGYYASRLSSVFNRASTPLSVTIKVEPGRQFSIGDVMIEWVGNEPALQTQRRVRTAIGLKGEDPARTEDVLAAELRGALILPNLGHPRLKIRSRKVVVDHESQRMHVTLRFEPGPEIHYQGVDFEGLETVSQSWLERRIPWERGDLYDEELTDRYRRSVSRTGLFSAVDTEVSEDGTVLVDVREGDHRTISVGGGWSTTEGFGADVSWQHRNFFGAGETLRVDLVGSEIEQSLTTTFSKPDFISLDQTLVADAGFIRQSTDAFTSRELTVGVGLNRVITEKLSASVGIELDRIDQRGEPRDRKFTLLALPIGVTYDTTDNLLDPTTGFRIGTRATPTLGLEGGDTLDYYRLDGNLSAYEDFGSEGKFILAGRIRLGAIRGAALDAIPANRRFYAGGGGSIRGFGFQQVGPTQENGDPLGGLGLTEFSVEFRARVTETIGVVPFIEAGNVFTAPRPGFGGLRYGAGLGVRYYTSFGPIRLDLATPLDRRQGEDWFQIYVSIGQAF